MTRDIVRYDGGVVLIGGGRTDPEDFALASRLAPGLVAADGGGDRALALGALPDLVIGDMDSLSPAARLRLGDRVHPVAEQDSTDFGKCLMRVRARFYLALGFSGLRLDHTLAALSEVAQRPEQPIFLLTEEEVAFRAPPSLSLPLPAGERVSIFPYGAAEGHSEGLRWPIDGLHFTPAGRVGTSNEVIAGAGEVPVRIGMQGPALLLLPKRNLTRVLRAFDLR